MAGVTFDHVSKRFDGTSSVNDFELEIARRRVHGSRRPVRLRQDHGLRMLAGLEDVTSGPRPDRRPRRQQRRAGARDVAMVFQSYALYPHMTVYDNLAFGLRNTKVPKAEIDASRDERGRDARPERRCSSASRSSSPADSASASRSAGRSSASPPPS